MNRELKRKRHLRPKRLIVESLEPRLVLSAAGFAWGDLDDGSDFELRERHDRESLRAAFIGERFDDDFHRDRYNRRGNFGPHRLLRDRGSHDGGWRDRYDDAHYDDAHYDEDRFEDRSFDESLFGASFFEDSFFHDRDDRFEGGSDGFDEDLFESPLPIVFTRPASTATETSRVLPPLGSGLGASLLDEPTLPRPVIAVLIIRPTVLTSFEIATASTLDSLATSSTIPIRRTSAPGHGQSEDAGTTRAERPPVFLTAAATPSSLAMATPGNVAFASVDDSSPRSANEIKPDHTLTFVSLSAAQTFEFQTPGDVRDGASTGEVVLASRGQVTQVNTVPEPQVQEDGSLISWSEGEGGLVEIDLEVRDDPKTRRAATSETDPPVTTEQTSTRDPRDAVWLDFAECEFNLKSADDAADEVAELPSSNDQTTEDDTIALDEGGMIVLRAPAEEFAAAEEPEPAATSICEVVEIQIEPGIGVFQVVEVATLSKDAAEDGPDAVAATSKDGPAAESPGPSSERSAEVSEPSEPLSLRPEAATLSIFLAIAGLFTHRLRDKEEDDRESDMKSKRNRAQSPTPTSFQ